MDLLITVGKMNPNWTKSHDEKREGACGHHHEHNAKGVGNDGSGKMDGKAEESIEKAG